MYVNSMVDLSRLRGTAKRTVQQAAFSAGLWKGPKNHKLVRHPILGWNQGRQAYVTVDYNVRRDNYDMYKTPEWKQQDRMARRRDWQARVGLRSSMPSRRRV